MKWMEVTVFTTEQGLDAVCGRLDMLGINQVMIEQGRESIEQFLHDTAKYWDYADMDALVLSGELKEMPEGMVEDISNMRDLNTPSNKWFPTPKIPN